MATKQFYATGAFKYGTRMMRAGDPVEMDGPTSRLYTALGKISPKAPPKNKNVAKGEVETIATEPAATVEAAAPAKPTPSRVTATSKAKVTSRKSRKARAKK